MPPPSDPPRPTLLLVSASKEWTERLRGALQGSQFELIEASSGAEAMELLEKPCLDVSLALLDMVTADTTGPALCRRIRESDTRGDLPVVFISPLAEEYDRVVCFENGADDFITEPFFTRELTVRLAAVLRRAQRRRSAAPEPGRLSFGPLSIDLRASVVRVDGQRVDLTAREFEILQLLVKRAGWVLRRKDLVELLYGNAGARTQRVIDTYVKSIRRKLGPAGAMIHTIRGVGYNFDPGPEGRGR